MILCRECREGKHVNCDGTAWDDTADEPALCSCPELGHPRQRLACGCLVVVASRALLEPCEQHTHPLPPVSLT